MRRGALATALAGLVFLPLVAASAGTAETGQGLKALLKDVEPRRGVSYRWLAVVPLVRAGAGAAIGPTDPLVPDGAVTWTPSPRPGAAGLVSLRPTAAPTPARLLPSGTVLERDADERLTLVPTLLPDEKPVLCDAVPVAALVAAAAAAAGDGVGTVGRAAPIEFRRSAFSGAGPATLRDLLAIEALLLGLAPGTERVSLADLLDALPDRTGPAVEALSPIPQAYGGDVVGHAVLLGNRLVEIVLTSSSATYRSAFAAERRAIASSMVAWEELYGRGGLLVPEVDWPATVGETARVLRALGDPSVRPEKSREPRLGTGEAWRVKATTRPGRVATEVGWLLSDASGRATWFEVWPEAAAGPLPAPAPAPGAVPPEEDREDRKHGWIGAAYLERKVEQLRAMDTSGVLGPRIERMQRLLEAMKRARGS